jgi:branched-chain amino acid transport system permease protein
VLQAVVAGVASGAIYGLVALGIVLVYKGSRVLNFAQGEIGTLSLFVAWWMVDDRDGLGLPWLVGAAAAVAVAAVVSAAFERFVVREMEEAGRLAVAVATVGLLLLLVAVELKVWGPSPKFLDPPVRGLGPRLADVYVSPTQLLALATAALVGLGLTAFLRRTDFGLGVLATAQDPSAARLVGVKVRRVSMFTWVTAGVLGALAALLVEPTVGVFAPGFMTRFFVFSLAAALIGGLTSLPGAFAGGIVVGVSDQVVQYQFIESDVPGTPVIAVFAVILVVLLLRPQGLLGQAAA